MSEYLNQCLDSILSQSLKEIEIICVDDGSTDNSMEILLEKNSQDSRIRILQQENKGGGAARNLGLNVAKGKYLSFLDSDDFFEPEMLESAYHTAEKSDADITIFEYKIYNTNTSQHSNKKHGLSNTVLNLKQPLSHKDIPQSIFSITNPAPWNKLYKHDFIKRYNLRFQEIKKNNDLYFGFTTLYFAEKIAILNKPLLSYRTGTGTNTQATTYKNPNDIYYALIEVHKHLSNTPSWNLVEKSFINEALNHCIGQLDKLRERYPHAFEELKTLLNTEGYEKLGISKHPKADFEKKWNYWRYQEYLTWKEDEDSNHIEKIRRQLCLSVCQFYSLVVSLINVLRFDGAREATKQVLDFIHK